MRKLILYPAILICVLLLAAFFANERNRYAVFSSSGEIRTGKKFGVSIGQNANDAKRLLIADGYREALDQAQLQNSGYPNPDRVYFLERGWRRGAVWLVESNNSVAAIGWNYQLGAP